MPRPRTSKPRSESHAALGKAIEAVMKEAGMTQEGVAGGSGLDAKQVGSFVCARGNPTYDTLLRLCDGLPVRLGELVTLAEEFEEDAQAERNGARALPSQDG